MALSVSAVYSAYSSAPEQCDQLVWRAELAWSQLGWRHRFEHTNSLRHVNPEIVLRCLDTLVTEPQSDFANITRCLQDIECASVPENVERDSLFQERWTVLTGFSYTVDGNINGPESVYAADVDGDGYTDVLGAARVDDDITWWEVIGYSDEGILESSILDAGLVDTWDTFLSNSLEPTSTSVAFQFRSSKDAGDMGNWSDTVFSAGTPLSGILADSTPYLQYRVILETDDPSNTPLLEDVSFSYTVYVSVEESSSGVITSWALLPASNPSYGYLSALITVPEPGFVELQLYDVTGRVIAGVSQEFSIGTHSVNFHGLAKGVYFCVMRAGDYIATEQVVVLR